MDFSFWKKYKQTNNDCEYVFDYVCALDLHCFRFGILQNEHKHELPCWDVGCMVMRDLVFYMSVLD